MDVSHLDVRKLRVLQELEQRGTIAEVAEVLHLTSSAVSQQLAALSRDLGVPLIEPVGRRVRLTGAGRVLLRHAQGIFTELERAQAGLAAYADGLAGEVNLAGFAGSLSMLALPAIVGLRTSCPDLHVALQELDPPESMAALLRGEVDIVIGVDADTPPGPDERFFRTRLMIDPYVVAMSADHPLATAPDPRVADLAGETWIFPTPGVCRNLGLAAVQAAGITPTSTHTIGDLETTLSAITMRLGVSLLPQMMAGDAPPGVVFRPAFTASGERLRRRVFMATRQGGQEAPDIATVLEELLTVARAERFRDDGAAATVQKV